MSRDLRIFVTGAAGFIGSHVASFHTRLGHRVLTDVNQAQPRSAGHGPLGEAAILRSLGGERPDVIVHAAGSGTVAQVAADPAKCLPANLSSLLAVLEYARIHAPQAHIVLLSSAALYGNAPAFPQSESDAREPVSLYGVAKAQSEELAAFYGHQHGLASTSVRLFSVYGPGLRKQLLWDAMVKFRYGPASFFGTGRELRDWVHIDDVVEFIAQLAGIVTRSPLTAGLGAINCASGRAASTAEVLGILASASGAAPPEFNGQTRPGDPPCLLADCSRALDLLGWKARIEWRTGVAAYAQWYLEQAPVELPAPSA